MSMTLLPLIVDQRSASLAAPEPDVQAWAAGKRVFVSSLISDMPAERAAVRDAIRAVGAAPVMFEDLGAQDITAEQAYLSGVRTSEIYVGMWGPRYGVRMSDGYSATEAEYREAERDGLRLCLFVNGDASGEMDGAQKDLIAGARNLYTTSSWSDATDLGQRVEQRLRDLAAETLAPWVRVGRTMFRAREIASNGQTIVVKAHVFSEALHHELTRLRDSRASGVPFASASFASGVQVTDLTTRTISTSSHEEQLTLVVQDQNNRGGRNSFMNINGVPAEEVARRSLSDGLFGTNELGDNHGWFGKPTDPFEELRGLSLDDSVLRPVARVLFGERLLADGVAGRVDAFALGPSHQGSRWLRVAWTPPRVYSDGPDSEPVTLEGKLTGL